MTTRRFRRSNGKDRRVRTRWTPLLARVGHTPISSAFLEHAHELKLTPSEQLLLIQILSFKWDEAAPFPAVGTLATRMGVSERQVRKLLAAMEHGAGVIRRVERIGRSNSFDLQPLFEKLEALVRAKHPDLGRAVDAEEQQARELAAAVQAQRAAAEKATKDHELKMAELMARARAKTPQAPVAPQWLLGVRP